MSSDQHLLPGESFAGYKKRILDTKSKSFCGAKWYYATVWLNTGQTTSCHHPLPHQIDPVAIRSNPKLLSNTPQKKRERAEMQKGIQCKGCDYCWRVENLGTNKISDRVYKSVIYSDEDLQKAHESNSDEDFNLRYLELSFDRTCNFACSYCNPAFSTTWAKDIKTHGAYADIGKDGHNHYGHSHENASIYDDNNNPYVEAFFKWWDSDLKKTLSHLRLTGGEPLMSKHTWKLLDMMANGESNVSYFAINTNLIAKQSLVDRLIGHAGKIKNLHIYTSNESMNAQAEYIRYGLDWVQWENNVNEIIKSKIFSGVHSMCTINSISLHGLTEYLEWCVDKKNKYGGPDAISFTLNILRFPNFQSCLILPMNLRKHYADKLKLFLQKNRNILHEMEAEQVERLIDYLDTETNQIPNVDKLSKFFKNYYLQYDKRRGKNFVETFPELGEWYNGI